MNTLDFSFEQSPWDLLLDTLRPGDAIDAVNFLTMMEGEPEETVEAALQDMEDAAMVLDISNLPKPAGTGEAARRLRQEEQLVRKGLSVAALDPSDPLRLYLEEVAMTPAFGDAQIWAEKSAAGDENAMLQLTNLSLSRVVEAAKAHVGKGVLMMDLIQEGSLGLWQAIQNWRSGDFEAYSQHWIDFYMAKAVTLQARSNGVGQKMRTALEDYRSMDEQLLSELGRNPTVEEVAERLHLTADAASAVQKMLENARLLAQAKKQPEPEEEELAETQAVEDTAYFQMRQRINELLSELDEADRRLLTLRYGLEGGKPLDPETAGRKLGLTPEEVVAREATALAKLRK